jgi:hypothetical protein
MYNPGAACDSADYTDLTEERDGDSCIPMVDRGSDSNSVGLDARNIGTIFERPKRAAASSILLTGLFYALRNCIERYSKKLNDRRWIATRYKQMAANSSVSPS